MVAPNVRGSSGYGKSFLALDNGVLREDAVRDIGSLLVWIGAQPAFDREHVAVMGGSYGGYMALASLVSLRRPAARRHRRRRHQQLRHLPVATPPPTGATCGAPSTATSATRTCARSSSASPRSQRGRIKRPLLVVAGQNDPRVPASESEQLVWRVRAAGGEVWYLRRRTRATAFARRPTATSTCETAASFLQKLAH